MALPILEATVVLLLEDMVVLTVGLSIWPVEAGFLKATGTRAEAFLAGESRVDAAETASTYTGLPGSVRVRMLRRRRLSG
jgi:hypothetical protein